MYKKDLALNNQQWLIWHKTKRTLLSEINNKKKVLKIKMSPLHSICNSLEGVAKSAEYYLSTLNEIKNGLSVIDVGRIRIQK